MQNIFRRYDFILVLGSAFGICSPKALAGDASQFQTQGADLMAAEPCPTPTKEQYDYEAAMEARLNAAMDSIAALENRSSALEGTKLRTFKEILHRAVRWSSVARTKLKDVKDCTNNEDRQRSDLNRTMTKLEDSVKQSRLFAP